MVMNSVISSGCLCAQKWVMVLGQCVTMFYVLCPCLCQSDQEATPAGPSFLLGLILENKQASDLHSTTHVPYSSGVRQYQRLIAITESYSPFTVLPVFDCSYIAR